MRLTLPVLLLASVAIGIGLILPSCSDIPEKTCFADRVQAVVDDAGPQPECTSCLQTRGAPQACCDAVGACQDDPACTGEIKKAHECVLRRGPAAESFCKGSLVGAKSKSLYACMRGTCGKECGVPSCDVDPSVVLLANASCDGCIGGACCTELNDCYKSRRCKLSVECIVQTCQATLGSSMTALASTGDAGMARSLAALCPEGRPQTTPEGIDPCILGCIGKFTELDGGTTDDEAARCLAFKVYECGARNACGPKCEPSADAGP